MLPLGAAGLALAVALPLTPWPAAFAASPTAPSTADAAGGRLEGRVSVTSELAPRKARFRIYPEYNPRQALPASRETNELENIVVYLEQVPFEPSRARPATPPIMEQRQERFVPHVLPIVAGWEVEFPNRDPIFHNVFSLSKAETFDLGRYPRSTSKAVRFDEPGVVKVYCHIHADMTGVVLVLDNPYFVKPRRDGSYAIDGIPPGRYTVIAWHERARRTMRAVEIRPGEASVVDFKIPIRDEPGS